jgi:GT2 family glycosyltransferase
MVDFSIIITTYNTNKLLFDCLDSFYKYIENNINYEIIIIDNYELDNNLEKEIKSKYKNIFYFKNEQNGGYGKGNNLGAKFATGNLLVFVNPDIVFIEPVFSRINKLLLNHRLPVLAGIRILNKFGKEVNSFSISTFYQTTFTPIIDLFMRKTSIILKSKSTPSGCFLIINKQLFELINGFDENVFMYGEESYIIQKLKTEKIEFDFVPIKQCQVVHLENSDKNNKKDDILIFSHLYLMKNKNDKIRYIKTLIRQTIMLYFFHLISFQKSKQQHDRCRLIKMKKILAELRFIGS